MPLNPSFFYVCTLFLTALVSLGVAYLVWQRRLAPGSIFLAYLLAAVAEWSFSAAMEALTVGQADKVVWSKIEYLGASASLLVAVDRALYKAKAAGRNCVRSAG